jgi:uncharacterized membrane protein YdjX (TVP38/TMEM64 family)
MELLAQHRIVWRRAVLLAVLCFGLAAVAASGTLHAALLDVLAASRDVIVEYPVLGALLFLLLAAISAMFAFVSIAILVPVAVYLWGEPVSMLLLWVGWILGGAAAYGIARLLGRRVVHWLTAANALNRLEHRLRPDTPFSLIVMFQLGLPSEIPGYVLGLVRYPFGRYLLALAIVELPYTIATIYLGAGVVGAKGGLVLAIGLSAVVLSVGAFYLLRRRMRAAGMESPADADKSG